MFRFASPWFLVLLLLPASACFARFRHRDHGGIRISSFAGFENLHETWRVKLSFFLPGLKILGLGLLIIALARPQWGDRKINVAANGINIILALDLSESMRALDFKKNNTIVTRLEAVKAVVKKFIMKRQGDRIGMVVFGSHAFTQVPLTRDYNTIAFILDRLEIGAAGPNTAIGDAIGISLKRLEDIKSRSNVIILLTDGKSNAGSLSWQDAAKIAADRKVKIYTIGVGTKGRAPFLVNDIFGKHYVFQKVDVDLDALKKIAHQTSGAFFRADDTGSLEKIYSMIDRLEKTKVMVKKWVQYRELYPVPLAAGLGFLLAWAFLANTVLLRIP